MYITRELWFLIKKNLYGVLAVFGWTLLAILFGTFQSVSFACVLLAFLSKQPARTILLSVLLPICATLIQRAAEYTYTDRKADFEGRFKLSFRTQLLEKLFHLGPGFIDRKETGELINTIWERVEWIDFYLFSYVPTSAAIFIFSAFGFGLWMPTSKTVGLSILTAGLLVVAAPPFFHGLLKKGSEKEWESNDAFYAACLDGIQGITTLKAFNANMRHREKVNRLSEENRRSIMANLICTTMNSRIIEVFISLGEITADISGAWLMANGKITSAQLIALFFFMQGWAAAVRRMFGAWLRGNKGAAAFEYAAEILNSESAYSLSSVQDENKTLSGAGDIEFHHVTFSYGPSDAAAVDDATFTIREGTQTALVGSSGSGKSTVANLMFGFYKPQSGTIRIAGNLLGKDTVSALQNQITVIWQDSHIFHASCMDNIRMARPEASDEEVFAAARKANIHEMILQLSNGYQTMIGDGGRSFSGGEKQRISLARAFLRNTPILMLDEATSSLDRKNEAEIQSCIRTLSKGKTVLIIAHRLDTIRSANQICVMEKGKIVESGTHGELMKIGNRYAELMRTGQAGGNCDEN